MYDDDDAEQTVPQTLMDTTPMLMRMSLPGRRDTVHVLESYGGSAAEALGWGGAVATPGIPGRGPRLFARGAALTHVGLVREGNEDAYLVWPEGNMALVADGMGGHAAGEVASAVAVETVRDRLVQSGVPGDAPSARDAFVDAVRQADARVAEVAEQQGLDGMGTTLVGLWLIDDAAVVVHVGDSRLYRLRDGQLEQITGDHNLGSELKRRGIFDTHTAMTHPQRHMLTRSLGGRTRVAPDQVVLPLRAGDRFLLCSDGLTDMVSTDLVRGFLGTPSPPNVNAQTLVEAALAGGGRDNITVVVVHVTAIE